VARLGEIRHACRILVRNSTKTQTLRPKMKEFVIMEGWNWITVISIVRYLKWCWIFGHCYHSVGSYSCCWELSPISYIFLLVGLRQNWLVLSLSPGILSLYDSLKWNACCKMHTYIQGLSEVQVRSPAEAKNFPSSLCVKTGSGAHLSNGYQGFFPWR
jgi:hypothetical protein